MREIFALIRKIGHTRNAVLITGESGTGKELIARAIHQRSKRAEGPFLAVSEFIRCVTDQSHSAEITFTHEAWAKIHEEMDSRF